MPSPLSPKKTPAHTSMPLTSKEYSKRYIICVQNQQNMTQNGEKKEKRDIIMPICCFGLSEGRGGGGGEGRKISGFTSVFLS